MNRRGEQEQLIQLAPSDIAVSRWDLRSFPYNNEALDSLVKSLRRHGVLNPLRAFINEQGEYELIAGHRRLVASIEAGLETIPVRLIDYGKELARTLPRIHEQVIIDNLEREDLSPLEVGLAIKALMDEQGYTRQEVGRILGKSMGWLDNRLQILNLTSEIHGALLNGDISFFVARQMTNLSPKSQIKALETIKQEGASTTRLAQSIIKNIKVSSGVDRKTWKKWLPIKEAADKVGISVEEMKKLCIDGVIKYQKEERWFVASEDIEKRKLV